VERGLDLHWIFALRACFPSGTKGFGRLEARGCSLHRMSERSSNDLELVVLIEGELRIFPLSAGSEVSLGRDAINHIQIDHPSVSRRHAVLRLGQPLVVEDLGSANGTFVHDRTQAGSAGRTERLRRLGLEAAELAVGESVQLGAVTAVVRHRHVAPPDGMIVRNPSLQAVYAQAERAAAAAISVILLGETGVGKEVLARFIHARSPRAARSFVAINCAAFSEALLEGELFGYEKGAFTGAVQARPGLFEAADGGTLFLDEVGELAQPTQAKFLRVLEERTVLRLGARAPRPVDARFIAATNRDLEAEVRAGRFREDLFYRLNGLSLAIPPLRERSGELESLARSFVHAACRQLERPPIELSPETLRLLSLHRWPGNVRELKNVMERAVVLCAESSIGPEYLPASLTTPAAAGSDPRSAGPIADLDPKRFHAQVEALQRARIVEALARCGGNQTQAAKLLGVARRTLVAQLVELGIPRPRTRGTLS
jgi:two-component system, NtrC family, response regulator AtoC